MISDRSARASTARLYADPLRTSATTLTVIVPVFNEQHLVEASLSRLHVLGDSPLLKQVQVIVVDNGSTDQTPAVLQRFQACLDQDFGAAKFRWNFLRIERNRGRGDAVRKGIDIADCDLVVAHDADLEYYPADLLKMVKLFLEEEADAVFGSRFRGGGEFRRLLYLRHSLVNWFLTFLGSMITNLDLSDIETGYKMVRRELLQSIPIDHDDFRTEPELAIKLAKRDARIFEVPIRYSGRTRQEGKKIGLRDGILTLGCMARNWLSDDVYKEDAFGSHVLTRLRRAPRFSRWMADMLRPHVGQRVLELGAGIGNLTVELIPRNSYWASDRNPLYLHNLRRLAPTQPYLHVCLINAEDSNSFPKEQFDTVICRYTIEHAEDDLLAMRNVFNAVSNDGNVLVLVPHNPSFYGTLDKVVGHLRRYTLAELTDLGNRAGLRMKLAIAFNRAGSPAWWWDGKVVRHRNIRLWQVKLFNFLVPVIRLIDSWLPFPPLTLIGIFEKVPKSHIRASQP
jgi:glycosyltransferase involved in cell wall biosynthesis